MRTRVCLIASLLFVIPSLVAAASVRPVPATEAGYVDHCLFTEQPSQDICDVAILALPFPELTGVRFSVQTEDITWTPLQVLSAYTTHGNWEDLSVAFGFCTSTPVVAATVRYFCPGESPCGRVLISAPAGFPSPLAQGCSFDEIPVSWSHMTVNGVYDMLPGMFDPDCFCPPVATKQSTWGKVKALYRN